MSDSGRADGAIFPPAHLDLFGFPRTPARVVVIPRSVAWRVGHALGYLGLSWACIAVVMWVPPHFPWILTAFFLGIFFFVKYIRQRYTLMELEGKCPKCGAPQTLKQPTRLAAPHRIYCPSCHQALLLHVRLPAGEEREPLTSGVGGPGSWSGGGEQAGAA